MEAQFLEHYNRELGFLRELGGEFAQQYPAVAGRLGMDSLSCSDPFVERLLEGFAFLAARVHRRLDAEFPEFSHGLLETIYPHYTRPIPAATMISFEPDANEGSLVEGYRLPKGTRLHGPISNSQPTPCRFDTTEDVDLWPLKLEEVSLVGRDAAESRDLPQAIQSAHVRSYLRIRLKTTAGIPLSHLAMDRLRVHLRGDLVAHRLFELLMTQCRVIAVRGAIDLPTDQSAKGDSHWTVMDGSALVGQGFEDCASLLPDEPRSFSGYRLLQEYFLLPEKFLSVSIGGLQPAIRSAQGQHLELLVGLAESDVELNARIRKEHLALYCVPAINLFKRRADRVLIAKHKAEQHLVVDRSRPMDFEVWSVEQMSGFTSGAQCEIAMTPLYAPAGSLDIARGANENHGLRQQSAIQYALHRRPRQPSTNQIQYGHRSPYLGSEVFLTLSEHSGESALGELQQLAPVVYCTNRDLALLNPTDGWRNSLSLMGAGPVSRVVCLSNPTRPRSSLASGRDDVAWRLINHLTPNYLTLGRSTGDAEQLRTNCSMIKKLLSLYCHADQRYQYRQLDGLLEIENRPVVRQLPIAGPILHGRGVEVGLTVDETAFEGGGAFLLGCVLERFFSRFTSLNSFTQFSLRSLQRGAIHRFPLRIGDAAFL